MSKGCRNTLINVKGSSTTGFCGQTWEVNRLGLREERIDRSLMKSSHKGLKYELYNAWLFYPIAVLLNGYVIAIA